MSWVLLKNSDAQAFDWSSMPGDEDSDDHSESHVSCAAVGEVVPWATLKKAMVQVKETACVGYTEAPSNAVFA